MPSKFIPNCLYLIRSDHSIYCCFSGQVPIIGAGGITSGRDAYDKIRAGASLIQIYSAIAYEGFPIVKKIKRELAELLR